MPDSMAAEVLKQFDINLTEDEEAQIDGLFEQYLFYVPNKTGSRRKCECTHRGCGSFEMKRSNSWEFFELGHRNKATCPKCGKDVTVLAKNKLRSFKSIQQRKLVALFRHGENGSLLITCGVARREYEAHSFLATDFGEVSRTYFAPNMRMQWDLRYDYSSYNSRLHWRPNSRVYEPFQYSDYSYIKEYGYHLINPQVILETDLKYCQIADYMKNARWGDVNNPTEAFTSGVSYLSAYVQYPNMEMAVRLGLNDAVKDLILFGKKNVRSLDWSATTAQGFMKLEKAEVKEFLAFSKDVDLLKIFQRAKKYGCVHSLKEFIQHNKSFNKQFKLGYYRYVELIDASVNARCSLVSAENYVKRVPGRSFMDALQLWADYLRNAKLIGYDLTDRSVAMPKNLEQRHDDAAATAILFRAENHRKMGEARAKKLRAIYEFEFGGLCIVVPEDADSIIAEGNSLRHCVGGYAARHMAGKLDILFLRKANHRDKSMVTMELAPRKKATDKVQLRQIHGYQNDAGRQPARQKYAWFLEVWIEWMEQGSPRDKEGNPVIQAKEAAV